MMAASKNLSPQERALRARIAVNTSWSRTADRAARTAHYQRMAYRSARARKKNAGEERPAA